MYIQRDYRRGLGGGLETRQIAVAETDLAVSLLPGAWTADLEQRLKKHIALLRQELEEYIAGHPAFLTSHQPLPVDETAPPMAFYMARAGNLAGVGPMAAVAGAFAEAAGLFLQPFSREVVVENGGDIYMAGEQERLTGVFAGNSPFSGKLALRIKPAQMPLGICTSSGTVGPSFSYGRADAVCILAPDTLLADAAATGAANLVQEAEDVEKAVNFAAGIKGITGALAIKGEALAAWGQIELVPLTDKADSV